MKYMLLMNTMAADSGGLDWGDEDLQRHIAFMREINARLRSTGEFVLAEGLAFPDRAKLVVARSGGAPLVDEAFSESEKFLAGFWIIDVADAARAYAIAGEISAAPGPGGEPLNFPVEVRPIMSPPPALSV